MQIARAPGRILQADKSGDCILQTRVWEYEISGGKRGAIQFRNSCIKDTKNLPFARVKKRERGRKGTGEREK